MFSACWSASLFVSVMMTSKIILFIHIHTTYPYYWHFQPCPYLPSKTVSNPHQKTSSSSSFHPKPLSLILIPHFLFLIITLILLNYHTPYPKVYPNHQKSSQKLPSYTAQTLSLPLHTVSSIEREVLYTIQMWLQIDCQ
jgi:hypothetical protein